MTFLSAPEDEAPDTELPPLSPQRMLLLEEQLLSALTLARTIHYSCTNPLNSSSSVSGADLESSQRIEADFLGVPTSPEKRKSSSSSPMFTKSKAGGNFSDYPVMPCPFSPNSPLRRAQMQKSESKSSKDIPSRIAILREKRPVNWLNPVDEGV